MNIEEIRRHLNKQPFVPFRVFLSDGASYHVPHPDFALVSRTHVEVGLALFDEATPGRSVFCDPLHITRIAPVPAGHADHRME